MLAPRGRYVWDSHDRNSFARLAHEIFGGFFPTEPPQFWRGTSVIRQERARGKMTPRHASREDRRQRDYCVAGRDNTYAHSF